MEIVEVQSVTLKATIKIPPAPSPKVTLAQFCTALP